MAMLGLEFSLRKTITGFIIAILVAFFFGFIAGYNAAKETNSGPAPKIDLSEDNRRTVGGDIPVPGASPKSSPPKIDLDAKPSPSPAPKINL